MELIVGLALPAKEEHGIGRVIKPSIHDINLLAEARTEGLSLNSEQFASDVYLDGLI